MKLSFSIYDFNNLDQENKPSCETIDFRVTEIREGVYESKSGAFLDINNCDEYKFNVELLYDDKSKSASLNVWNSNGAFIRFGGFIFKYYVSFGISIPAINKHVDILLDISAEVDS